MTTIYKKKLLKEIETIPDKHFKSLYKMIHYFKIELKSGGGKNVKKYSLAGIWKGSHIDVEKEIYKLRANVSQKLEKIKL